VADGVTGILTPVGDAAAFAAAVAHLLDDPDERARLARAARAASTPATPSRRGPGAGSGFADAEMSVPSPSCVTPPPTGTPSAACRA